ncbi:MAG: cadherin-like domain-containing protein, partial [Sedimenticolaceae bacterium]
ISTDTFALDENSANGTIVGSVTGADPELGALKYAIIAGNTDGAFAIDATTGQITVANSTAVDYETTPSFTLTVAAIDAEGAFDTAIVTINLNDINVAPVNNVPGAQSSDEDNPLTFNSVNGNLISISEEAGAILSVTVSVENGTLALSQTTGLTIDSGANGTATMTVTGTVEDINAALDGLQYAPTADYAGADTLPITSTEADISLLNIDVDLLGYYEFANADPVNDGSPAGLSDGALVGGATIANDPARGDVLSLDGSGDAVQISGLFGNPADVTLAAWVNLTSADTLGTDLISLGDNVAIRLDNTGPSATLGGVTGYIYEGSGWVGIESGQFLAGTGWHHVAYVFDDVNDTHTLYVDGTAIATSAIADSIDYTRGGDTFIGAHARGGTDWDLNGLIDDARIYSRALSVSEITALAAGQPGDSDSLAITVTPVNDAPTAAGKTVTTGEDTTYTFTAADFNFNDVDGDTLASIRITSLEGVGSLQLSGLDVTLNQVISKADIDAGNLTFAPAADDNGAGYDSFGFSVNDGTVDSASSYTMTMDVTPVNDAPTTSPVTLAPIAEDSGARLITQAELLANASDIEGDGLTATGLTVSAGTGSLVDNGNGTWNYAPAADDDTAVSFSYSITDGTDTTAASASLDITPVNDGPT